MRNRNMQKKQREYEEEEEQIRTAGVDYNRLYEEQERKKREQSNDA